MSLAVDFRSISKSFGLVEVLHSVSFSLQAGRVVGLLGENGAGKSTLVKILSGYEQATEGDFTIDGVAHRFANSREAEHEGVVLIHQEFNLAEQLTIAQNIFLGHERMKGWMLDDRSMNAAAVEAMKKVGINRVFLGDIGLNDVPYGKVKFRSDEWWDILDAAFKTATRLNIKMGIFNGPGWSQSGGPWVQTQQRRRDLFA